MATPHRKPWSNRHQIWIASVAASLSLAGASAWAQPIIALPAGADAGAVQPSGDSQPADAGAIPAIAKGRGAQAPDDLTPAAPLPDADGGSGAGDGMSGAEGNYTASPVDAPIPLPSAMEFPTALVDEEPGEAAPSFATGLKHVEGDAKSRLSNVPIGIQPLVDRPPLIVELNDHFLSPGFLSEGIELPTGEIVRPSFWVFGTNQVGYNYFNNQTSPTKANEILDRLDIFGQLNLTATERLLVGFRPFDTEELNKRVYTRVDWEFGHGVSGMNIVPETLFFEGDFGEIFPGLDPYDTKLLDYGFSVGRQPVLIQDGLLINANRLDAVSVTRNTLNHDDVLNCRTTAMFAWDQIHRNNDDYDPTALLFGLFNETDFFKTTINVDLVYVNAGSNTGSAFFAAVSGIQRFDWIDHTWNSSLHALTSVPTNQQDSATGRGTLLFGQFSMTPKSTPNLLYVTGFWGIDNFSSAARNPEVGGPLGQVGILFASPAFGDYGSPLNNQASDVAGGTIGYQIFLDDTRKQLIFEVGGRKDTNNIQQGEIGLGARYQQAFGQHSILLLDGFISQQQHTDMGSGARISWNTKF